MGEGNQRSHCILDACAFSGLFLVKDKTGACGTWAFPSLRQSLLAGEIIEPSANEQLGCF